MRRALCSVIDDIWKRTSEALHQGLCDPAGDPAVPPGLFLRTIDEITTGRGYARGARRPVMAVHTWPCANGLLRGAADVRPR